MNIEELEKKINEAVKNGYLPCCFYNSNYFADVKSDQSYNNILSTKYFQYNIINSDIRTQNCIMTYVF